MILCEMPQKHLQPLTDLPSLGLESAKSAAPSVPGYYNTQLSEQQAQTVSLFSQALCIASAARGDEQKVFPELMELDNKVRLLLEGVLHTNWKTQDGQSTMVALAVR